MLAGAPSLDSCMKKVRLFVYDFDGTLVDSKLDIADSVNRALKELGLRELPREIIFGYIGDGVEALMSRALSAASVTLDPTPPPACAEAVGVTPDSLSPRRKRGATSPPGVRPASGTLASAVEAFKKHYGGRFLEQTRLYPHCRETVDYFSDKKHAIFSNKPLQFIEKILAGLDFQRPFAPILGGDSLDSRKPDPRGLIQIMDALRIPAEETVMVGDTPLDVETGRRAGVLTCAVAYGLGDRTALEQARPGWMIDDFSQLREIFC